MLYGDMTYDTWKCTDPNDQWLGDILDAAWRRYRDGEITVSAMGDYLLDAGYSSTEVRHMMAATVGYPIPKGYFGKEGEPIENKTFDEAGSSDEAYKAFGKGD